MRILMISAAYTPAPGGVATHVATLANGLVRHFEDVSVDVLTQRFHDPGKPKKEPGRRLVVWKRPQRQVSEFDGRRVVFASFIKFAMDKWNSLRPDLIHAHDFDSVQIGWMLKAAFDVPLIATMHRAPSPWKAQRFQEDPKDCYMQAILKHQLVDRIVVPSNASLAVLQDQGFPTRRKKLVEVVPHGISKYLLSIQSDPAVLDRLGIPTDSELILCPV